MYSYSYSADACFCMFQRIKVVNMDGYLYNTLAYLIYYIVASELLSLAGIVSPPTTEATNYNAIDLCVV